MIKLNFFTKYGKKDYDLRRAVGTCLDLAIANHPFGRAQDRPHPFGMKLPLGITLQPFEIRLPQDVRQ